MTKLSDSVLTIGTFDLLCNNDSAMHRIDARVKLLVTLAYLVTVVSWNRYTCVELLPLAAYPLILCLAGKIPAGVIFTRLLLAAPFVLMVGIFNPIFDTQPGIVISGITISGGWISFISILLRFLLTVSTTLIVVAVTGMTALCTAAERLGMPRILVTQLALLYRYLFVLTSAALRMMRAADLRAPQRRNRSLAQFGAMVGHLLLRTVDRAQRVHTAMCLRGFNGSFPARTSMKLKPADWLFLISWMSFFGLIRFTHLPLLIGQFMSGAL